MESGVFCPIHISTLFAIHVSPLLAKKTKITTLLVIRIAPSLAMYVTPPLANLDTHIDQFPYSHRQSVQDYQEDRK